MTWFLVYLFMSVEKIALLFGMAGQLVTWSMAIYAMLIIIAFGVTKNYEKFKELIAEKAWKRRLRMTMLVGFFGAFFWTAGQLLPTKKELAIIIAVGGTWEVLTSQPVKDVANDALILLRKEMENAIKSGEIEGALRDQILDKIKEHAPDKNEQTKNGIGL